MAILLSSCASRTPPPEIKADPAVWQLALAGCGPTDIPGTYHCPQKALEKVYDLLAHFEVDLLSCNRDLKHALDTCTIRITQAESRCDSWLYQWWFWLPIGVVAGASGMAAVFLGVD